MGRRQIFAHTRKVDVSKATWTREFKLPWREAGPPNHHDDKVSVVNKELSLRPLRGESVWRGLFFFGR